MLDKSLLKSTSTSYSQFLQTRHHVHCMTESPVDNHFFKRSISLHYQHLYAAKKWQNSFYRIAFYTFSAFFCILSIMIFFKTTNPTCSQYLVHCSIIKNWVNLLCILLSTGAFALGYLIHPEKDAIKYIVKKVERELNSPAKHIQIEFNAIISNLSKRLTQNRYLNSTLYNF